MPQPRLTFQARIGEQFGGQAITHDGNAGRFRNPPLLRCAEQRIISPTPSAPDVAFVYQNRCCDYEEMRAFAGIGNRLGPRACKADTVHRMTSGVR